MAGPCCLTRDQLNVFLQMHVMKAQGVLLGKTGSTSIGLRTGLKQALSISMKRKY